MKLNEKAMLVSLNISQWYAHRFDDRVSQEACRTNGAKAGSGRFNKILVDLDSVKRFRRAANDARTFHYQNTLPWSDDGSRILPASNYLDYTKGMRKLKDMFDAAVAEFIDEYPALIEKARVDLGQMFNAADYPRPSELANRFGLSTAVSPLPDKEDFRVDLSADEVASIQANIQERIDAQIAESMQDLWHRLHKAISHLRDKLREKDSIFRDSLVGNISELTDLLPKLNVTMDENLDKMTEEARKSFAALDPDELRTDKKEREVAAEQAEEILKKMAAWMGEGK